MRLWPLPLWSRLLLALLLAAVGIVALQVGVAGGERAQPAPAATVAPPLVSPLAALGFVLQPAASPVLLCHRLSALAPDVAPVVQVLADGSVALRRPPPLPRGPTSDAGATRAGIVLPVPRLRELGPAARGTLVALLAALALPRPLPTEAVQLVDVDAGANELAAILSWVP